MDKSAFTEITGHTLKEIVGKDPRSILRGADTDKSFTATLDGKIARRVDWRQNAAIQKNRERMWVEFEWQPIKNKDGAVIQHMIVSHDVTEHVTAAEALAERAESIRAILDTVVTAL